MTRYFKKNKNLLNFFVNKKIKTFLSQQLHSKSFIYIHTNLCIVKFYHE